MRRARLPFAPLLLLLAVAAGAGPAAASEEGGEEPAPPPAPPAAAALPAASLPTEPEHPALISGGDRLVEFRGEIEAGVRAVSGREGRYEQDVNLDDGFRLFRIDLEGTSLEEGLIFDRFSLRVRGVGDPDRGAELFATRRDGYDLTLRSERQEYVYRATFDAHPFDTVRERDGARLRLHLMKRLTVTLSTDRLTRSGDAALRQQFSQDVNPFSQILPVAAPVDYERREHSVGVAAAPGIFRVGVTHKWSRASDDAFRTLDRPSTPDPDRGTFHTDSDIRSRATTGHAGARLLGGKLDLGVAGGYVASETDSTLRGRETVISNPGPDTFPGTGDDTITVSETRGRSGVVLRERFLRAEALYLPHEDWEVRVGGEQRKAREDGFLDARERLTSGPPPAPVPAGPFFPSGTATGTEADLQRAWVDGAWRASETWRFRGGAERLRESVRVDYDRDPLSRPRTVVGTVGADFTPSERFDASLLLRRAGAAGAETQLSTDEGNSASLRLRARRTDGWHSTVFGRFKERENDGADARVRADTWGFTLGRAEEEDWWEIGATRHDFVVASDTHYVVNLAIDTTKNPHRVRYSETVDALTAAFSRHLSGPLRGFGAASWSRASGDLPSTWRDASLGLGWRICPSTEFRAEFRAIAYHDRDRNLDDYDAKMVTLSVVVEF